MGKARLRQTIVTGKCERTYQNVAGPQRAATGFGLGICRDRSGHVLRPKSRNRREGLSWRDFPKGDAAEASGTLEDKPGRLGIGVREKVGGSGRRQRGGPHMRVHVAGK